jgi:transposase
MTTIAVRRDDPEPSFVSKGRLVHLTDPHRGPKHSPRLTSVNLKENQNPDKRLVSFNKEIYKDRNIVERLIGWLKENRRIFSRFEKTAKNFAGMIKLGFIRQYFRLAF